MGEAQPVGVEELPLKLAIRNAVDGVADDGEVDRREVNPNLMCSAGLEADRQQCVLRQELLDLEMRDGLPRVVRVERAAKGIVAVTAERSVDPPAPRTRSPASEGKVVALQPTLAHELLQPAVRLLGSRDDQKAGGVAVETVDDARTLWVSSRNATIEQGLDERPTFVPRCRVHYEARRLVDYEQMLVLVGDPQLELLGLQRNGRRSGCQLKLDRLPALETKALRARLAIHEHCPRAEQALRLPARVNLGQRRDEPVEPLAGGVSWNDD
jgi:hypothetical protein